MFEAGAAARDITPRERMYLGGYSPSRTWTSVHDPISTRALALRNGESTVVFIAVDSIGLMANLAGRIRAAVQAVTHVPANRVFVAATHSHSTPDVMGIYGGSPAHYHARVVVQSAAAALAAWNALAPARARWAQVEVADVSMNRRIPPGELDRQCTILQVAGLDGAIRATLTDLSLHPVCLGPDNQAVTADFIHYLRARLEAQFGGLALHVNGTEGNVNPAPQLHGEDRLDRTGGTFAMAESAGHAIADAVIGALPSAQWQSDIPIEAVTGAANLPVDNPAFRQAIETGMIQRDLRDGATTAEVGVVRVGGVRFVTLPGEAFAEIGLQVKGWWPGEPVGVIGMCNDHVGYVIPPELYTPDDYEASVSASPRAWPALERALRETAGLSPATG